MLSILFRLTSKKNTEFEFTHNSNGNTDKFNNVIKVIEKAFEDKL